MPQETAKVQTNQNYQSMPFLNKPNYIHSPDNEENFISSEKTKKALSQASQDYVRVSLKLVRQLQLKDTYQQIMKAPKVLTSFITMVFSQLFIFLSKEKQVFARDNFGFIFY